MGNNPTGRKQSEPEYQFIGHYGRQDFDDTLANNAEMLAFDYSKVELRLLAFYRPSLWRRCRQVICDFVTKGILPKAWQ